MLKFELHFSKAQWTQHNLGRFRLSVTDTPSPLAFEQKLLATKTILSPWSRLGAAYHAIGEFDSALDMFARSIETKSSFVAKAAAGQQAAAFENMFSRLQERFPGDQSLRLGQAKFMATQHIDENEFQLAVEILSPALADFPNDLEMLNQRAGAWMKLAEWQAAAEDSSRIIDLETDDVRRRTAQRTRAEALMRMGQFEAGTEAELQVMMRSPEWDGMRDAYSAALLAGNPEVARMVAGPVLQDRQRLGRTWMPIGPASSSDLHTAMPGLGHQRQPAATVGCGRQSRR
jgi:tetratricopeptide (TPR) repeat protein